jgi:catechol 2,3-dioxygenase-like lactoylglutathione lyase family enzyme
MTSFEIQRLDHVALNVSDRPRSIAWYRDVLGLELQREPKADDWPAFVGELGACLTLFQAPSALRHVCFAMSSGDFAAAREHLERQGVEARFEDHGSSHSLYFPDPDGHVIELTTYEVS